MRTAVYQRHLATLGGGERYALDWARWLADRGHDVDVLAPPGTTLEEAGARLGQDVSGLRLRELDALRACEDATERSVGYDLFVNVTHGTRAASLARRGVLVVHFPDRGLASGDMLAAAVRPATGAPAASAAWAYLGAGFRAAPGGGHWTGGQGTVAVGRWGPGRWSLRMALAARTAAWRGVRRLEVGLDGQPLRALRLPPRGVRHLTVDLPPARGQSSYAIQLGSPDAPTEPFTGWPLGAHLRGLELRAPGATAVLPGAPGRNQPYVSSYERVVSNSAYTAQWVRRRWGSESPVVHPAVTPIAPAARRDRSIVVVGRFFSGGHSKRQLELLRVFKRMCADGLEGWRLDLVGGGDRLGNQYLDRVRREAEGHPVDVLVDVPRDVLEDRLGRAALVWQASGWGADAETHPQHYEHFGVGLVEAMSAGAVPVALAVGGAVEVVRDGVDGVLWTDSPEVPTRALIEDEARRRAMSESARERARAFGPEAFGAAAGRALAGVL